VNRYRGFNMYLLLGLSTRQLAYITLIESFFCVNCFQSKATNFTILAMATRVQTSERIVVHVCVEVEALWVAEFGIRHRLDFCTPIRGHKPTHSAGVVPSPEVVVVGFGVAFLAGTTRWCKNTGQTHKRRSAS